jgi:hypothetical protein
MNTSTFSGSLAASPDARICRISLRKWLAAAAARFREEIARRQLQRLASSWRFACAVELERARAERHGGSFSLVVLLTPGSRRTELARLARTLRRRVRSTDLVGRVGDDRLGVLLPDTKDEGALALVHDVLQRLAANELSLRYEVIPGGLGRPPRYRGESAAVSEKSPA